MFFVLLLLFTPHPCCRACHHHYLLSAPFSLCFITPGPPGCSSCWRVAMETETHFWSWWVFQRFISWQLLRCSVHLQAPCRPHVWVMWAMTSSGLVVMNVPPLHESASCRFSLHSGIEQSLSVQSGEAENIYENPEDIRQVMNSGIFKNKIPSDEFHSLYPFFYSSPTSVYLSSLSLLSLRFTFLSLSSLWSVLLILCFHPPFPFSLLSCYWLFINTIFVLLSSQTGSSPGFSLHGKLFSRLQHRIKWLIKDISFN